jgi:hypothetical protein
LHPISGRRSRLAQDGGHGHCLKRFGPPTSDGLLCISVLNYYFFQF